MEYSFELNRITKNYPNVVANKNVTVKGQAGSVLCLVGENGAGKSTLMNILYGMVAPDEGEIKISGHEVILNSSHDAIHYKIGMVFQHFMLINELSCFENIIIGSEPVRGIKIDRKRAMKEIQEVSKEYGMEIPLGTLVGELSVGHQQKLEILKTLYRKAEIILLDEPTAVLTPQEAEELFVNIKKLAKAGKTIVLITHKLDEVMSVADDIVIMRDGQVVANYKPQETSIEELSQKMVGTEIPPMKAREEIVPEVLLSLEKIFFSRNNKRQSLNNVSFELSRGEILGIAGISGNGQRELAQIVSGIKMPESGKIILEQNEITKHTRLQRIMDGISYIPEDRNKTGVSLNWSIEDNMFAGYQDFFSKRTVINRSQTRSFTDSIIEKYLIKAPDPTRAIKTLSGGNVQKVVVARETAFNPKVLIAAEPSRGVDVGAISLIYNHIIEMRNKGVAVLLISSSLDELFVLSDRIAVMFEGAITGMFDPTKTTRKSIGLYMAGVKKGSNVYEADR